MTSPTKSAAPGGNQGQAGDTTSVSPESTPYATTFARYWDAEWRGILPLPAGQKWPPPDGFTGHAGADPSFADVTAWAEERPDANIAIRVPDDIVGIDVDAYEPKRGAETIAEAERRWGALPATVMSTSRDDGVSGIRFYRLPAGHPVRLSVIRFGDLGDVEIVRRGHRYAVVEPSRHPSGATYRWRDEHGLFFGDIPTPADCAELPARWVTALAEGADPTPAGDPTTITLTDGEPSQRVADRVAEAVADLAGGSRHDATCANVLRLVRLAEMGEPGVAPALGDLCEAFVEVISAPGEHQRSTAQAHNEFNSFVRSAMAKVAGSPSVDVEVVTAFPPSPPLPTAPATKTVMPDRPIIRPATALTPAQQLRWLATGRIAFGVVSLLVGEEGIGKSLLWVWIVAAVTNGKPLPEFGIPARPAARVLLAVTEDDWSRIVAPRLIVAGADLTMIDVISFDADGTGAPQFPRDLDLVRATDPPPSLIVVDAWLDTVPARLDVKNPQHAREALHPWKDTAAAIGAAVLLLTHTNRVATGSVRDKYGITSELRKSARSTLFAQLDDDGRLVVGAEKSNLARTRAATAFTIESVRYFDPTEDDDGTVPRLIHAGESDRTAAEMVADRHDRDTTGSTKSERITEFLRTYIDRHGGAAAAAEVIEVAVAAGFDAPSVKKARAAKNSGIESQKVGFGGPVTWSVL